MALTPGTDAYIELAPATAFLSARGLAIAGADDAAKEAALRRGADWLDRTFGGRFVGQPEGRLHFPAKNAVNQVTGVPIPDSDIPESVQEANARVAVLMADPAFDFDRVRTADAAVTEQKVDVITVRYDTNYSIATADGDQPAWVEGILLPVLAAGGAGAGAGTVPLARG